MTINQDTATHVGKHARALFVTMEPSAVDAARGTPLTGKQGAAFDRYLSTVGWDRNDVAITHALADARDATASAAFLKSEISRLGLPVVALGESVAAALESIGITPAERLPHPAALVLHPASAERRLEPAQRKMKRLAKALEIRAQPSGVNDTINVIESYSFDTSYGFRLWCGDDGVLRMSVNGTTFVLEYDPEAPPETPVEAPEPTPMMGYMMRRKDSPTLLSTGTREFALRKADGKLLLGKRASGGTWVGWRARVLKSASATPPKQIVMAVVLDPYREDAHGHWMAPADVEQAAHAWLAKSRVIGQQHTEILAGAEVVESWLVPYPSPDEYRKAMAGEAHKAWRLKFGDDIVASGTWILGVKLPDSAWSLYQKGELTAFSPGLWARDKPVASGKPQVDVTWIDLTETPTKT